MLIDVIVNGQAQTRWKERELIPCAQVTLSSSMTTGILSVSFDTRNSGGWKTSGLSSHEAYGTQAHLHSEHTHPNKSE